MWRITSWLGCKKHTPEISTFPLSAEERNDIDRKFVFHAELSVVHGKRKPMVTRSNYKKQRLITQGQQRKCIVEQTFKLWHRWFLNEDPASVAHNKVVSVQKGHCDLTKGVGQADVLKEPHSATLPRPPLSLRQ